MIFVSRTSSDVTTETVDGRRLLYTERVTPEGASASRKDTRAVLDLLEKTLRLIESEEAPSE
jgi:hypothetical protein